MTKDTDELDNIGFIQYLNRRVLEEAEEAISLDLPGDNNAPDENKELLEQKKKNILKRRNRMYGLKNPLIWVFEKIADTELKIEKQRPKPAAKEADQVVLDDKDMAIVRRFIDTHPSE